MVKNFYVGGVLDNNQYHTCTADIAFRRMQNFHPSTGSTIKWNNINEDQVNIQQGSFVYDGGIINLKGISISKGGNQIGLRIKGCAQRIGNEEDDTAATPVYFSKSFSGYMAHVELEKDENVTFIIYDLLGRVILEKKLNLISGSNTIEIGKASEGIFLIAIRGESFSQKEKLFF